MNRRKVLLALAAIVAALGVLLVFLYARGADARAAAQFDLVRVLVASQQIEPGETVDEAAAAGKFTLQEVPQNAALPGALTSTESIAGLAASTWIYTGEQILPDKFGADTATSVLQIPDKLSATSVQLTDPARVAGFVSPGSEVAVYWTKSENEAGPGYTRILLDRVTVLGVGSVTPVSTTTTDEEGGETTEQVPTALLTLALDQDQATRVIYAASNGEVYFTLLTNDSKTSAPSGPVDEQNLFE